MNMTAKSYLGWVAGLALFACLAVADVAHAQDNGSKEAVVTNQAALFYSVAITISVTCISAGYAVGKVGAAALGAAAEKPELLGRALIFVGLAEGIAIYGLIIGIMLIGKIG